MPCLAQVYSPKLPTSNHCKSLSSLIRETYAHCHVSCMSIPSSGWSSDEEEEEDDSLDNEFDTKQVILNEMRSRQMKKRSRSSIDSPTPSSMFVWSFTPLDPRSVLEEASHAKRCIVEEEEEEEEKVKGAGEGDGGGECGCDGDDEGEAFFSVKSFFSRSTSRAATVSSDMEPPPLRLPAMWDGFRRCEGWPFGLCRRATVVPLPPLPRTPADSWKWRKRINNNNNCNNAAAMSPQSPALAEAKQQAEDNKNP